MILGRFAYRLRLIDNEGDHSFLVPSEMVITNSLYSPLHELQLMNLGWLVRSSVRSTINEED